MHGGLSLGALYLETARHASPVEIHEWEKSEGGQEKLAETAMCGIGYAHHILLLLVK
jgi:hypothetical protein